MSETDQAVRRLVDHEHALRTEARHLLSSAGSLAACCGRLAGGRGDDLVGAWAAMTADNDRSPEEWPLAGTGRSRRQSATTSAI